RQRRSDGVADARHQPEDCVGTETDIGPREHQHRVEQRRQAVEALDDLAPGGRVTHAVPNRAGGKVIVVGSGHRGLPVRRVRWGRLRTPARSFPLGCRAPLRVQELGTRSTEATMPRHANYVPHGDIPAVLLPFSDDLSIDERGFRSHLRDVAAVKGISAITINAHSTEVASCSFDEQRRVLDVAQDEVGGRLPLINGVWADGSHEAARIARMAQDGGASALLVFPPAPFTLGQSADMAVTHFKTIADASDLPI